jgi:hypothetical protein
MSGVAPAKQELLNQDDDKELESKAKKVADDEEDEVDEAESPEYSRETIGPRVGEEVGKANSAEGAAALEQKLDTEDVVPLIFSRAVNLQDKGLMHHWAPGIHMVPISLAGTDKKTMHWWLRHNGVRRAGKPLPNPNAEEKVQE